MNSQIIKDAKNADSYKESQKNAIKMMLGVSDDIISWKSGVTIEGLAKLYEINQSGNFCDSNMDRLKERLDKKVLGQPRVNLILANMMTNWPQSKGPYRLIHLYGEEHSGRHYVVRSLAECMGRPVVRIDLSEYTQYSDLFGMEEKSCN